MRSNAQKPVVYFLEIFFFCNKKYGGKIAKAFIYFYIYAVSIYLGTVFNYLVSSQQLLVLLVLDQNSNSFPEIEHTGANNDCRKACDLKGQGIVLFCILTKDYCRAWP